MDGLTLFYTKFNMAIGCHLDSDYDVITVLRKLYLNLTGQ